MHKKLCLCIILLFLECLYLTGSVQAFETYEGFAINPGSVLLGDYPQISVQEPAIHGEEGDLTVQWEIHFSLGQNTEQWDRILIGELLADSVRRSPIRWSFTDETGNIWPPNTTSSALEMKWLSPDTMGWNIYNTEDMPFGALKDKQFTIKLTAEIDPVLNSSDNNNEGILGGTFINCYYNHKLMHYNSTYTGSQALNASTGFKRVSLFENGMDLAEDSSSLIVMDDNMFDTYNLHALEFQEPEYFSSFELAPAVSELVAADDSNYRDMVDSDYRDLYVEGEEIDYYNDKNDLAPEFDISAVYGWDQWDQPPQTDISGQTPYVYSIEENITGYDSSFEFDSILEYPNVSEDTQPQFENIDYTESFIEPAIPQLSPAPQPLLRDEPLPAYNTDITAYGSAFSYHPQNVDLADVSDITINREPIPSRSISRSAQDIVERSVDLNSVASVINSAASDINLDNRILNRYNDDPPEINTSSPAKPKTRSAAPYVVSYNRVSDVKYNPTTREKSIIFNIFIYLFLCSGISLLIQICRKPS